MVRHNTPSPRWGEGRGEGPTPSDRAKTSNKTAQDHSA